MIAAALAALVVGCGEEPTASEFDPTVAEEFVRNKTRADVRANPVLSVKAPQSPEVACDETTQAGGPPPEEDDVATFVCDVEVLSRTDETIARQTWRTEIELDPVTGDTVVRGSRRVSTTIDPAR